MVSGRMPLLHKMRRTTDEHHELRMKRRRMSSTDRSLAVAIACGAAIALGGGTWVVSDRSFDRETADVQHVAMLSPGDGVPREHRLRIDNPFALQRLRDDAASDGAAADGQQAPSESKPVSDNTPSDTLPVDAGEEETECYLSADSRPSIVRLPPISDAAAAVSPLGDITSLTDEEMAADSARPELETPELLAQTIPTTPRAIPPTPVASEVVAAPREVLQVVLAPQPAQPSPYAPQLAAANIYAPTSNDITAQLLPAVQRACRLAQRGAVYAAQAEFIQVIRRVALANDAECGTDQHSRALAEGLRALDEAVDFVPVGTGLEANWTCALWPLRTARRWCARARRDWRPTRRSPCITALPKSDWPRPLADNRRVRWRCMAWERCRCG